MTSKEFLALIQMTNKEFPSIHDLAGVFDAADLHKTGFLEIDKVKKSVLKSFDSSLSEAEIKKKMLYSLDLDESGRISCDECCKLIFGMRMRRIFGGSCRRM
jgi:Ca2+-binding EF-hand superfamily protein